MHPLSPTTSSLSTDRATPATPHTCMHATSIQIHPTDENNLNNRALLTRELWNYAGVPLFALPRAAEGACAAPSSWLCVGALLRPPCSIDSQ